MPMGPIEPNEFARLIADLERVTRERDEARQGAAGQLGLLLTIGSVCDQQSGESPADAAKRVVQDRDSLRAEVEQKERERLAAVADAKAAKWANEGLRARLAAVEGALADDLRAAGWMVAVHNDYRLGGVPHTFWLFTHPDGRWVKGEGHTDAEALADVRTALSAPPPATGTEHVQCPVCGESYPRADLIAVREPAPPPHPSES